jgi:hypothetical protein
MVLERLLTWISRKIIIGYLANNKTFQRLAVHIDSQITNNKGLLEQLKKEPLKAQALTKVHELFVNKSFKDAMAFLRKVQSFKKMNF